LLRAALFGYLLVCLLMMLGQRKLIYHPKVYTAAQTDELARQAHMERWYDAHGKYLGMKRLCPRPARAQALLTYGNGGHATGNPGYFDDLQLVADFDLYILNYPGYEDRPGVPSEAAIYQAADEAVSALSTNLPLYLVGQSLGTGVACYLAGAHPDRVRGIVLQAPFNCLAAPAAFQYPWLPVRWILWDHFASDEHLTHYHGPVGITVGTADHVVPARFGQALYDGYAGPKRLWIFPGADHGDVFDKIPDIAPELKQLWGLK
jgi:fermentation-respiration switch protein FrsA (DUF1100 family)